MPMNTDSLLHEHNQYNLTPPSVSDECLPPGPFQQYALETYAPDDESFKELLDKICSPGMEARIWSVASKALECTEPPKYFPEYTEPGGTTYVYRDSSFWTSGFFPGILYQLLGQRRKMQFFTGGVPPDQQPHVLKLEFACQWWTEHLHANATLQATHDLGFLTMPWARPAWELNHDHRALQTLKTAALTLFARFSPAVGLVRSWDTCVTRRYRFLTPETEFMTIIDNMMNLDLLFYVAMLTGNEAMWDAARTHARTTRRTHVRHDSSVIHLVVFDPESGDIQQRLTNQGYADDSCWTRGQAWAIAGFAETYNWTKEDDFLETACSCADYFLRRLPDSNIPPWDFDAVERDPNVVQPPDTSAAMIASYGMLLLHKALRRKGNVERAMTYLDAAQRITWAVVGGSHAAFDDAAFGKMLLSVSSVEDPKSAAFIETVTRGAGGDTLLTGATINNYEFAPRRWANHGLVYADYYLLVVKDLLLEIGGGLRSRVSESDASGST